MRLINVKTLELEEFLDSQLPSYAILSHTWETDEIAFEDMRHLETAQSKPGFAKLRFACTQAKKHDLLYLWADTCCIDKKSSAELQEAINSMYRYYANADVCYVYLADVSGSCPFLSDEAPRFVPDRSTWRAVFIGSKWFTRGWTLQELIAPVTIRFYGETWNFIGTRSGLMKTISTATGIQRSILAHTVRISTISVAQRMAWAAHRETSRIEDRAYSLLGIFNVNMPMLYGEGSKAFTRLQEEIIKTSADHSIFAWEFEDELNTNGSLLASSPSNFASCQRIVQWGKPGAFDMTNRGLRISLPILESSSEYEDTLAIINCRYVNDLSGTLALRLRRYGGSEEFHAMRGPTQSKEKLRSKAGQVSRLVFLPHSQLKEAKPSIFHITREFEPEASHLKFWIPQTSPDATDQHAFQIVDAHPGEAWDQYDGIMHATDEPSVRGAVTIQTATGNMFSVAFGFDLALEYHPDRYMPGVWATTWSRNASLESFIASKTLNQCYHDLPPCRDGRCPYMPSAVTVHESPASEILEMRIQKTRIMDDTVFIVSLQLTDVYELEVADDFLELDINEATRSISRDVQPESHAPSILGSLIQRLDTPEIGLPSRVWMQIPFSLQVAEVYPRTCQSLANRTLYWPVVDGDDVIGAVLFTTSMETNVILRFSKDLAHGWKIELGNFDPNLTTELASYPVDNSPKSAGDGGLVSLQVDGCTLRAKIQIQDVHKVDCLIDIRFEETQVVEDSSVASPASDSG